MPQVVTDTSLNPGIITNGGTDLFSWPNVQQPSVLSLQARVSQPLPPGTLTAANLLIPDQQVSAQLVNFPANVYDTSPVSLLYHFMAALLGDAGAGQLRKRQMIARLQQAITSTHFYDLDSFYGALFGAQRGPSGAIPDNPATGLPVSPYTDLASPDAWDEIQAADALFRERVIALAQAITLGGTMPGMRALAEAITGTTCQVWETWRLLDNADTPSPGFQTWDEVEASYPAWSAFPSNITWQTVEGYVTFAGDMFNGTPTEIVIQPKKSYDTTAAGLAEQGSDQFGILSVTEVLKPATALVTVNPQGIVAMSPVPIAAAWSTSQNMEIVHVVTPSAPSSPAYAPIASSYQGPNAGMLPGGTYIQPSPPMCRVSTGTYSYASDVTTVTAQAVDGDAPGAPVTDGQDYQTVVFPGGAAVRYLPAQAVMPPSRAVTGRTASPVAVRCAPYSGPRVPVTRST